LNENLDQIARLKEIADRQEFDECLNVLNGAVQATIKKHIPEMKPSPYAKRWWTLELTEAKKQTSQLAAQAKYHRLNQHHPIHREHKV